MILLFLWVFVEAITSPAFGSFPKLRMQTGALKRAIVAMKGSSGKGTKVLLSDNVSSQNSDEKQQEETTSKNRKKFYQKRWFKGFNLWFWTAPFQTAVMSYYQYQSILNETADMKEVDPELYDVCMQIKKDYNITEDVQFRLFDSDEYSFQGDTVEGVTKKIVFQLNDSEIPIVMLNNHYKKQSKSCVIQTIAHELEHVRQLTTRKNDQKYIESYNADQTGFVYGDIKRHLRLEAGADAAAADYQYCFKCLQEVKRKRDIDFYPHENDLGYFTTKYGYFSAQDYDMYIQRAQQDDALCPAHRAGVALDPKTPLKDFLPTRI